MNINNSKEEHCNYNNFRKARYFDGEILDQQIFIAEQTYHNQKRKLLNKMLHGWGVVCGLRVKATNPPSSNIIVEPGLALDCHGNEILVCDEQTVDLSAKTCMQKTRPDPCEESTVQTSKETALYVVIRYQENPSDPVSSYAPSGNCGEEKACDYSRTREGFCIEVWDKLPPTPRSDGAIMPCNDPFKCPTCCPDPHYVVLATIKCGERRYMFFSNETINLGYNKTAEIRYQIKRVIDEVCINNTSNCIKITDTYRYDADSSLTDTHLIQNTNNLEDKFEISGIPEKPEADSEISYTIKAKKSGAANFGSPISLSYSFDGKKGEFGFILQSPIYIGNTEAKRGSIISDSMIRNMENRQFVITFPLLSWLTSPLLSLIPKISGREEWKLSPDNFVS